MKITYNKSMMRRIKLFASPTLLFKSVKVKLKILLFRPARKLMESIGINFLSKPYGADGIQKHDLLMNYVNFRDGFFVEIGGHDGYFHSPTYYLEAFKGWRGVLVEPVPGLAARCNKERSRSSVYNFACVSGDSSETFVEMVNCGHSSHVSNSIDESQPWIEDIQKNMSTTDRVVQVEAITLSELLDAHFKTHGCREIDLFVLDVEGYELPVLDGFDFGKHAPKYILIESHTEEKFKQNDDYLVKRGYVFLERISQVDYLYGQKLRKPLMHSSSSSA